MRSTKLTIILAASLFIISGGFLAPDALAQTKQQEDTAQEKDYPIIIRPTGVMPASVELPPKKYLMNAQEGSIRIISADFRPFHAKTDRTKRIEIWVSDDIGYIAVERTRTYKSEIFDGTSWIGKITKGSGFVTLTIDNKKGTASGHIVIDGREFVILPLKNTKLHFIYEINPDSEEIEDCQPLVPPDTEHHKIH